MVRDARAAEMPRVGELRVRTYTEQGLLGPGSDYAHTLRRLGDGSGDRVLVAVEGGSLLGTATFKPYREDSEVAHFPDEAELRAVAVAPESHRRGVGRELVEATLRVAREYGTRRLVLSTQPAMTAAQHMYEKMGFVRIPERDWSPYRGLTLLAYERALDGSCGNSPR
ncbi:N-acetylglutamate synthase-like GNAT family acetyltransferase [Haloactinospora alba]|uniref:N-acetylglutamate synthase-like GNAT family acetyltransferase n=2 Tax=Haloactinospora alba TaxID=405555 RepID=A0A543NI50_9ACTN|nr:N-acetylglutamate synthase-like GNAT family acetyltransferase [Haloactinospora alba]